MSEDSSKVSSHSLPWSWIGSIGVFLAVVVFSQFFLLLILNIFNEINSFSGLSKLQSYIFATFAVVLPAIMLIFWLNRKGRGMSSLGWVPFIKKDWMVVVKNLLLYVLVSMVLMALVSALFSSFDVNQAQQLGFETPVTILEYIFLFALIVVFTPISEEVLFRGLLFRGLNKSIAWVPAALISAVVFGLVHGQLNVAIDTAVLGFFSARALIQSGTLKASVAIHMLKNALAFSLLFLLSGTGT